MGNGCGFAEGTINSCHKSWFPLFHLMGPAACPPPGHTAQRLPSSLYPSEPAGKFHILACCFLLRGGSRDPLFSNMSRREAQSGRHVMKTKSEEMKENKVVY